MNLWLAAFIALLCALAGVAAGLWFSRLKSWHWTIGYFIPLFFVLVYAVGYHVPGLMFTPPFCWLLMGLRKFAVFGFIATMVLTTPMSRLPQKRLRVLVGLLMVILVFFMAIFPFIAPMVDRSQLSRLHTNLDKNGICLQTTDYTCGPASAVTALRKLGLPAEEGQIAIWSCTSSQEGTPEDMLADALNREYGTRGLSATCRAFKSVEELKYVGPTLAVIKYGFLVDHWVTVLAVTDTEVILGDPLVGLQRVSYEEFAQKWRFIGVILERKAPAILGT